MTRLLFSTFLSVLLAVFFAAATLLPARAVERSKQWALYSWIENEQWHYSLIHRTEQHPDHAAVQEAATDSVTAIETRISLLEPGSDVTLNPLPVLNMELHRPPYTTVKEFERVCDNAKVTWGQGQ